MSVHGYPAFPRAAPYPGPDGVEQQASAEFAEALGQLRTASELYFGFSVIQPAQTGPGGGRKQMSARDKALAAHKIREAITNLEDVVRFMELP